MSPSSQKLQTMQPFPELCQCFCNTRIPFTLQVLSSVLSASLGSLIFVSLVARLDYDGPLSPYKTAMACCFAACVCFAPYQLASLKVGLAVTPVEFGQRRLHTFLGVYSVLHLLVLIPVASLWLVYV